MFDPTKVINCFKNVLGWKNHYDLIEIPVLDPLLNSSETAVFYNDVHPAMQLNIIKSSIPENRTLNSYLNDKVNSGIVELLGAIISQKQYEKYARQTLAHGVVLDGYAFGSDLIINNGRFVGFKIKSLLEVGLVSVIKSIGIQVNTAQTLKIYVFHSNKAQKVTDFDIVISNGIDWKWTAEQINLHAMNEEFIGGEWIIGYYQDDLLGQALDYKKFNWDKGPCGDCDGGYLLKKWNDLNKYMTMIPFYVPGANLPLSKDDMFDLENTFDVYDSNFGLNFKVSVECDLTAFFCEHRFGLRKALGLQVTYSILKDIQFSQQINYIEENLKHMIIRDLEGDKDTNYVNIADQLSNEIKAMNFDHSRKSAICLPCDSNKGVRYGTA